MQLTPNGTAYDLHGNKHNPALVLIHGLGLTHETWHDYIHALKDDYFIISYDLLGHGQSALPTRQVKLSLLSEQLNELLTHLQVNKAHLLGFSLGGMINRRFAMDYPDKTASLLILNSPHEREDALQKKVEAQAQASADAGVAGVLEAAIKRWFTPSFIETSPDKVNWVRQTLHNNNPENYAAHRYVLAAGVTELIRPEPPLHFPCLIITCENDSGSTAAMSAAIHDEITNSKVIIIPELQHLGLLEQPDMFLLPIKDFLKQIA